MNVREIKDLIEFVIAKDIAEFELEHGEVKMRVKRGSAVAVAPPVAPVYVPPAATGAVASRAPASSAAPAGGENEEEGSEAGLHVVRSPIVGTFYESASPGAPAFVKAGDTVTNGQVLCIVEAMKLMNEVESDAGGVIVKRYVENAQPVEYGQPLFAIRAGGQ